MTRLGRVEQSPLHFGPLCTCVHGPSEREEQIGQPVDVGQHRPLDSTGSQRDNPARPAAADRARQMQRGTGRCPAGQNEPPHFGQLFIETIDPQFQLFHCANAQVNLGDAFGDPLPRIGQPSTDSKEVTLQVRNDLDQIWLGQVCTYETEHRIQLINVTVGLNSRSGFRHPGTIKETSFSGVSGTSVNRHALIIVPRLACRVPTDRHAR